MKLILALFFLVFCFSNATLNAQSIDSALSNIKNIRNSSNSEVSRVVIDLDKKSKYETHFLNADPQNNKPIRIYVDIFDAKVSENIKVEKIKSKIIDKIVFSQNKPEKSRVVIYLKDKADYNFFDLKSPHRIVVDIKEKALVAKNNNFAPKSDHKNNRTSNLIKLKQKISVTKTKFKNFYDREAKAQPVEKSDSISKQNNILVLQTKEQKGAEKIKRHTKPIKPEQLNKSIKIQKPKKINTYTISENKIKKIKLSKIKSKKNNKRHSNIKTDNKKAEKLFTKAWSLYNKKNYKDANEIFAKLHNNYPKNSSYTVGLIYSLIQLKREDKALKLLSETNLDSSEEKKIESLINFKLGKKHYENGKYKKAQYHFDKVLAVDPDNEGASILNAWALTNNDKPNEALDLFLELYDKNKKTEFAEGILINYDKSGNKKEAYIFSKKIGKTNNESLKKVSSEYSYKKDLPITAAQINSDPNSSYYNADKISLETTPYYRFKSGSSGTSELSEFSTPFTFSYPINYGGNLKFTFITHYLDSGDSPDSPFVGSAPEGGDQIHDLETSLWVFTPELSFHKEGYINYNLNLGLTPLNGTINPLPTFIVEADHHLWRINIHQNSVKESILSYVGIEDPFGNREFGRVLKTGIEGELIFSTQSAYWLSIIGGYDFYWGKNVESNNSLSFNLSIGKTVEKFNNNLSFGLYATYKHFSENLDFFTFGHGGYFSPENFIISGPTLRYSAKKYQTFWFDTQLSGGVLYYETEDAPFFPMSGDSSGEFDGDSSVEFGFNAKMEAIKLISSHFEIGGFSSINRSSDFTEFKAGLKFKYFPSSRNSIVTTENPFFQ